MGNPPPPKKKNCSTYSVWCNNYNIMTIAGTVKSMRQKNMNGIREKWWFSFPGQRGVVCYPCGFSYRTDVNRCLVIDVGDESRSSFVPEEPDELDDIADMWRWAVFPRHLKRNCPGEKRHQHKGHQIVEGEVLELEISLFFFPIWISFFEVGFLLFSLWVVCWTLETAVKTQVMFVRYRP